LRLEAKGDLANALRTYSSVILDAANQSAVHGACARVHLALGEAGPAIEYARRSIAADESCAVARVVLVKALLARGEPAEALVEVDALLARASGDGGHHYLRGKVLFALGRLDDARAAFDLACSLQPTLLEAMLLRREVDRCIAASRRQVGSQGPITFEIPASLAALRDVLIGGRTGDAIAALSELPFADDADAQLVLARMLVFDRQLERGAQIYDRVASMPDPHRHGAHVGKAGVLLDLGKLDSALALFELVCASGRTISMQRKGEPARWSSSAGPPRLPLRTANSSPSRRHDRMYACALHSSGSKSPVSDEHRAT
jgi:tetratricopeptide (TPR) repeat protein